MLEPWRRLGRADLACYRLAAEMAAPQDVPRRVSVASYPAGAAEWPIRRTSRPGQACVLPRKRLEVAALQDVPTGSELASYRVRGRRWPLRRTSGPDSASASNGVRGGSGRPAGRPARSRRCVLRRTRRRWPFRRTSGRAGRCVLRRTRRRWPFRRTSRRRAPASYGVRGGGGRSAGRPAGRGLRHTSYAAEVPLRMTLPAAASALRRTRPEWPSPWTPAAAPRAVTSTRVRQSDRSVHSVFASSTAAFAAQNCRRWRIGSSYDPDSTHQQQRPRAAGRRAARHPARHPHAPPSCRPSSRPSPRRSAGCSAG